MVKPRFLSILTGRRLSLKSRELLESLGSTESSPDVSPCSSSESSCVSLEKDAVCSSKQRFRLAPSLKRKPLSLLFRSKKRKAEQRPVSSTFNASHSISSDRFDDEEWLDFSLGENSDQHKLFQTPGALSDDDSPTQSGSMSISLDSEKPKRRSRRVRFGSVQVFEHSIILGHSCCRGPPLQLSWERVDTWHQNVGKHSTRPGKHPQSRSPQHLRLSPRKRHIMLRKAGVSKQSIVDYVEAQKREREIQQIENEQQEFINASPCPPSVAEDALDQCLWNADSGSTACNHEDKYSLVVFEDAGAVFETANFIPESTTKDSLTIKTQSTNEYPLLDLDAPTPSNYFSADNPQGSWTFDVWSDSFLTHESQGKLATSSSLPLSHKRPNVTSFEFSEAAKTEEVESDESSHRFHSLPVIQEMENSSDDKKSIFSWKRPLGRNWRRRVRARK